MASKSPAPALERIAVFLHDGRVWYSALYEKADGETHGVGGGGPREASTEKVIPERLLAWARERKARLLRLLVPGDVYSLQMELPEDLGLEETETALRFESAATTGGDPDTLFVAAVRARSLLNDGEENQILAAAFDRDDLERWQRQCSEHGFGLQGIGSLQLAAFGHYASRGESIVNLLFMREHKSFACSRNGEGSMLAARNIPVGFPRSEDMRDWSETVAKRLGEVPGPLRILLASDAPEAVDEQMRGLLALPDTPVERLERVAPIVMAKAASAEAGALDSSCPLVPLAVEKQGVGFWLEILMALLLLATIAGLWGAHRYMISECAVLRKRIESKESVDAKRQSLRNQLSHVMEEAESARSMEAFIGIPERLDAGLLHVIAALETEVPSKVRITRVREEKDLIRIEGYALNEQALNTLQERLRLRGNEQGLTVELRETERKPEVGETRFVFLLTKTAER